MGRFISEEDQFYMLFYQRKDLCNQWGRQGIVKLRIPTVLINPI